MCKHNVFLIPLTLFLNYSFYLFLTIIFNNLQNITSTNVLPPNHFPLVEHWDNVSLFFFFFCHNNKKWSQYFYISLGFIFWLIPTSFLLLTTFFFFLFWLHQQQMEVPRPRINPSCSFNLCHSCSNAGSLNLCTGLWIQLAPPQRQAGSLTQGPTEDLQQLFFECLLWVRCSAVCCW